MKKSGIILLLVILVIAVIFAGLWSVFKTPHRKPVINPGNSSMTQPANNSPVFRKDGVLSFLDGRSGSVIKKIDIEIADNENARIQGLMYRDSLPADAGMLFLMETEEPQAFWMRNTKIPLDIIYVDSQNFIVKICRDTKPYSMETIPSGKPALFVVEVNAGFCAQYKLKEGDRIAF